LIEDTAAAPPQTHQPFLYELEQRPPLWRNLIYGIQWALIMFPALVVVAAVAARALGLSPQEEVDFFQKILLLSGALTVCQTLLGHGYPLQEGPATALLLTFVTLAPCGLPAIQGGVLCGGVLLLALGRLRLMRYLTPYFTANVVGVILMLIGFTLLPHLIPLMLGIDAAHPAGEGSVFALAIALVLAVAVLSHWLRGFWQSTAMILGIALGTTVFFFWGRLDFNLFREASWFSLPESLWMGLPAFDISAVITCILAYMAVIVNSVGSIHGVGEVVGTRGMARRVENGIAFTGVGGIVAAAFGVVGTVSYSASPGVILVTRVASKYAQTMCGVVLLIAAFVPRLNALLAAIPATVVGAVLCVALASQVGAGITAVTAGERSLEGRDYLVVGLPVMLGTVVAAAPSEFFAGLPRTLQLLVSNGLVLGIILVLLLEHLLLRQRPRQGDPASRQNSGQDSSGG